MILLSWCGARRYLCENRLIVMSDNRSKFTVQYNCSIVKRLLRMLQQYVELRHAAFEHAAEVARNDSAAYSCTQNHMCYVRYHV